MERVMWPANATSLCFCSGLVNPTQVVCSTCTDWPINAVLLRCCSKGGENRSCTDLTNGRDTYQPTNTYKGAWGLPAQVGQRSGQVTADSRSNNRKRPDEHLQRDRGQKPGRNAIDCGRAEVCVIC